MFLSKKPKNIDVVLWQKDSSVKKKRMWGYPSVETSKTASRWKFTELWEDSHIESIVRKYDVSRILPSHLCPFPVNPCLQEQLNDPSVFVQVALFLLQLWVSPAHSSMSNMRSTERTRIMMMSNRAEGELGLGYVSKLHCGNDSHAC